MTIISKTAERVILAGIDDPETPPRVRSAILQAIVESNTKLRRSRLGQAIQTAQDPSATEALRIAAYQALVDFMNGEEVLLG